MMEREENCWTKIKVKGKKWKGKEKEETCQKGKKIIGQMIELRERENGRVKRETGGAGRKADDEERS